MTRDLPVRKNFKFSHEMTTRWRDNDVYAHVNNAVFFEYVDTAVNYWIAKHGGLGVPHSDVIGLVVNSSCEFFAPLGFPDPVVGAVGVERIGTSSVTYVVALFRGGADAAAALSKFTHVYVDAETRRPTALPADFRSALEGITI